MNLYSEMLQDAGQGLPVQVVTLIDAPSDWADCVGQQLLVYPDGISKGCIVDATLSEAVRFFLLAAQTEKPLRFNLPGYAEMEFFCDKLLLSQRTVIFGGGHISKPLVEFLAQVGYEVTVVDDRPDFANTARFPSARYVLCCSFVEAFSQLEISQNTAVVIVTRGHRHDLDCLRHVLQGNSFYIGMIGSKHKVASIFEALRQEGIGQEMLSKVHAPIGLDIHAQTPPEIALSIAAEVVAVAKGGTCLPLRKMQRGNQ